MRSVGRRERARRRTRRSGGPAAAAFLVLTVLAGCGPLDFLPERWATLEVTSAMEGRQATVEIAVAQAGDASRPPGGPVTTPHRQQVSVERAAVILRRLSGPEVRVRLRTGRGDELRHEVETTTSDMALVTAGGRYWPGSRVTAAGF